MTREEEKLELYEHSACQLAKMLRSGATTSQAITEAVIARIKATESTLHAFNMVTEAAAIEGSIAVDKKFAAGEDLPVMAGIPVAVKDNMCMRGLPTTCSSKILENFRPPYNATVIEKLGGAGAVIVGKTNLDEFAMGSSTENSAFGPTANPWDVTRVPGGSSGGSAAAVAAGQAVCSLGSDTGGSIRQPAALCGVVGLKPTYGAVSRYGLVAFASSLDQIGPFARNVEDCAAMLDAITGHDPLDSTSSNYNHPNYLEGLSQDVRGMKVAIPREFFGDGVDRKISVVVQSAALQLEKLGVSVHEVSLPSASKALGAYYVVAPAEASSNLARFDGIRYGLRDASAGDLLNLYKDTRGKGFGKEVKRRIMLGTYALSSGYYDAYYLKALRARRLVLEEFTRIFTEYDAVLTPTSPCVAFPRGEKAADPLAMYMSDICTIPANLAGIPGISVPCGFVDNLPVGMQLMGAAFAEPTLLRLAYAYEQSCDHYLQRPTLAGGNE